jgi:hypothetical protein
LWIFVGSLAAIFAALLLEGLTTKDWDKVLSQGIDLVKSAVLPVVTLVLGYYFGRSSRD